MSGKLRITAGAFKNRALKVPEGEAVRPTSERARQAMFNRLEHSFQDYGFRLRRARVADLFAGTGALGLEALSRGAAHVTFVEIARATHLKDNISALGVEDKTTVLTLDAAALPAAAQPYGLILMDAPYDFAVWRKSHSARGRRGGGKGLAGRARVDRRRDRQGRDPVSAGRA